MILTDKPINQILGLGFRNEPEGLTTTGKLKFWV
jgi:hypothetical protein